MYEVIEFFYLNLEIYTLKIHTFLRMNPFDIR